MIISASYKTDIPAFYGEWFRNRLRAGYCRMVNPYNSNQRFLVSLRRENVDGFVFWTKNLAPFTETLEEVRRRGFPFIVQYTINGYSRALESRVVDPVQSVDVFRAASERYGPDALVWRYDPIVLSSITGAGFHRSNFARLAAELCRVDARGRGVVHAGLQEDALQPRRNRAGKRVRLGATRRRRKSGPC